MLGAMEVFSLLQNPFNFDRRGKFQARRGEWVIEQVFLVKSQNLLCTRVAKSDASLGVKKNNSVGEVLKSAFQCQVESENSLDLLFS